MTTMKRLVIALVATLASMVPGVTATAAQAPAAGSPVAASPCGGGPADGLLLYRDSTWPDGPVGQPGDDLVVADGAGRELRRVDLPPTVYGQGTLSPGRGLFWTRDNEISLVNAHAGTATLLDIPRDAVANMAPLPTPGWAESESGWWLLGGLRQSEAFLINLESGDVHDIGRAIAATGDELTQILLARIAPDDKHVLIWSGTRLLLIATDDPTSVRTLGDDNAFAAPGYFRDGGTELVYSRLSDRGQIEVVIEDLASGEDTVLALGGGFGDRRAVLLPLPDPSEALLIWIYGDVESPRGGALEVVDLDRGTSRFLIAPPESVSISLVAPSGDRVLIGGSGADGLVWRFVDLRSGEATVVDALNGLLGYNFGLGDRWGLFVPLPLMGPGADGAPYVSVDLESGEAQIVLTQRAESEYSLPIGGADRRYAVIEVSDETRTGLVLLDLATGTARTIAEGATATGAFSPDGCWVAAATEDRAGSHLLLIPVDGGDRVTLPDSSMPVWVRP